MMPMLPPDPAPVAAPSGSPSFQALAVQCAPAVHPATLQAVVRTESGFNPFAIGVVGGRLVRQPRNRDEAVATASALEAAGWNYSVGLGQINRGNLVRYGLNAQSAFDPCANLRAGAAILSDCYARAAAQAGGGQQALRAAFSCYYSGSFARGFRADQRGSSYVQRVVDNAVPHTPTGSDIATGAVRPIQMVPALMPTLTSSPMRITARASPASGPAIGPAIDPAIAPATTTEARPRHAWDAFGDFQP